MGSAVAAVCCCRMQAYLMLKLSVKDFPTVDLERGHQSVDAGHVGERETRSAAPMWSVSDNAVDPFADDVGVAVMARVLLDHVQVDPADVPGAFLVVIVAGHDASG